ncbi:hypothetical protein ACTQ75_002853 [Vibrio alginolyticus]
MSMQSPIKQGVPRRASSWVVVPSCREWNRAKASKDFCEFLEGRDDHVAVIEAYMNEKNYVPLENNEQVFMILEMAYREVGIVAER